MANPVVCLRCFSTTQPKRRFHVTTPAVIVGAVTLELTFHEKVPDKLGLVVLFVIAGLVGTVALEALQSMSCGACRSEEVVPADSPRGRQVLEGLSRPAPSTTPASAAPAEPPTAAK